METFVIAGDFVAQWRPEHLFLVSEIGMLLAMMAANARATMLVGGSALCKRAKRIWLAAIWGLPFAGLVYLLFRLARPEDRVAAQVQSTR